MLLSYGYDLNMLNYGYDNVLNYGYDNVLDNH
jgi:hypothetical protein